MNIVSSGNSDTFKTVSTIRLGQAILFILELKSAESLAVDTGTWKVAVSTGFLSGAGRDRRGVTPKLTYSTRRIAKQQRVHRSKINYRGL